MTWYPIDTAPKDGSRILLFLFSQDRDEPGIVMASWTDYGTRGWRDWLSGDHVSGTHWMPLPELPAKETP